MANALATVQNVPATAQGTAVTPAGNTPQQVILPNPFIRGSTEHVEQFYDTTFVVGGSQQTLGPYDIGSYGFLRALMIEVNSTVAGNSAAVTAAEDAPWSAFATFAVQDVNSTVIFGEHSGYEMYLHHKYGGFRNQCDPKLLSTYAAMVTGTGGTGGSFAYILRINIERNARDALGALANMNSAQAYKVRGIINSLGGIYGTPPSTAPNLRVRISAESYSQPDSMDASNRPNAVVPPANNTTGFSSRIQPVTVAGQQTIKLTRIGNFIRSIIFVNRRAGTSRVNGEADFANLVIGVNYDSRLLFNKQIEFLRQNMTEWYDLVSPTFEAAGGLDNGVFVFSFMHEFDGKAGYELRDLWLPTTSGTRLDLLITLANAGVLTVMTDDVSPKGNVYVS